MILAGVEALKTTLEVTDEAFVFQVVDDSLGNNMFELSGAVLHESFFLDLTYIPNLLVALGWSCVLVLQS